MPTQQRKKHQTRRGAAPLRVSEPGIRKDYRRGNSNGNLTSILVMCLIVAFILLVAVIYLYQKKSNQPVPISTPNVVEQKPAAIQNQKPSQPAEVVVEDKAEPVKKKKKSTTGDGKETTKPAEAKKPINLEISGEKAPEKPKPVEEEPEVKKVDKANSEDEPAIPKSFMGGLSNPELERAKEENRKKKGYELE